MEEMRGYDKVLRHVGGELSQASIEGEVALPVGKPEMARVLMVRGRADTGSVELLDGRAMTDGTLTLNVCYLCEMGNIHSFESISTFKHTADMPGAKPGMKGYANAWVSGVDYSMTDGRRLNVNAVVDIMFHIEEEMSLEAVNAAALPPEVIAQTTDMKLYRNVCRASAAVEIEGESEIPDELPEISQVLSCDGYAVITEAFAEDGSVGIQGELRLEVIFAGSEEGDGIAQFFTSLPFSDMISAPMAGEEHSVVARARLKDVFARAEEDGTMHIEAVCTVDVSCEEAFNLTAVQDAYSIDADVSMVKKEIASRVRSASARGKYAVREKQQGKQEHEPARILAAVATPSAPRAISDEDRATIETVLYCQVVYVDQENVPYSEAFEIPVRMEEDAPGFVPENDAQSMVYVEQVQASFAGGSFELRVLLSWMADQYAETCQSIVSSLECEETEEQSESGIIVCFAAEGDTLWTIAKRYKVSTDEVLRYNPQAEEEINRGDKLILMCRP